MSLRMTLSSKIFTDTKRRAVSLRQLSFLFYLDIGLKKYAVPDITVKGLLRSSTAMLVDAVGTRAYLLLVVRSIVTRSYLPHLRVQ